MNFTLKPSLEHIALVKVAATLWNHHDIRTRVVEFLRSPLFRQMDARELIAPSVLRCERRESWQKIEDKVVEKVSLLPINETETDCLKVIFKEVILSYIQAVGFQILKWMDYHCLTCRINLNDLPNQFCWAAQGTIDKKETAKMLIRDESIDISIRYQLACTYCLEDDIRELWNKMPECVRASFYCEDPNQVSQQKLVIFWTYTLKGELNKVGRISGIDKALRYAAVHGNKVATEYFFQKLIYKRGITKTAKRVISKAFPEDRKCSNPPEAYYTEVLCFLLSQMNEDQQMKIFASNIVTVLRCFAEWPWQNFCLETANHVWNYLTGSTCHLILLVIIHKIVFDYIDCNYTKMFEELWKTLPNHHKSYIINDCTIAGMVRRLMEVKDKEKVNHIFKVIFKDATATEKNELIFSTRGRYICEDLINFDEWEILKFFIQLCIKSTEEIVKFKQDFEEELRTTLPANKIDQFFQILDAFAHEYESGKRKNEDENNTAKKLCVSE